jgi:hypothetical protein
MFSNVAFQTSSFIGGLKAHQLFHHCGITCVKESQRMKSAYALQHLSCKMLLGTSVSNFMAPTNLMLVVIFNRRCSWQGHK